jgi:hypothetical protein
MTPRERNVLYFYKHEIRSSINPADVALKLYRYGVLTGSSYSKITDILATGIAKERVSDYLLENIPYYMNLEYFVSVLHECGDRKLACHLFLTYISRSFRSIPRSTSGQRPVVRELFRNLKHMVHDARFENSRSALRQMANRFIGQMQRETNHMRQQLLADKCVAIIAAEIDAMSIKFDENRIHEHDVFMQMKKLVAETSNTSLSDIVYLSRLAYTKSIAGNFHESEDILLEARCKAIYTCPCLELVNMFYIEVYCKLWEFEKNPSEGLQKQLMMWGRVGLQILENEDEDTKTLWRRMFILRMVFCLIGLGNRANIIESCVVDTERLIEAQSLLSLIDCTGSSVETRIKMFFCTARARLNDLSDNINECIDDITEARKLANEGNFEELKSIVEYHEQIINRVSNDKSHNLLLLKSLELHQNTRLNDNAIDEQFALTGLQNPSHNYVLKNSDTYASDNSIFEMSSNTDAKNEMLPEISPLRLCSPSPVQSNICEIKEEISARNEINTDTDQRLNILFENSEVGSIHSELNGTKMQNGTIAASDHFLG